MLLDIIRILGYFYAHRDAILNVVDLISKQPSRLF